MHRPERLCGAVADGHGDRKPWLFAFAALSRLLLAGAARGAIQSDFRELERGFVALKPIQPMPERDLGEALLAALFAYPETAWTPARCEATTIHGRSVLEVFRSHRRIFTAVENSKWKGNTRAESRAETERLPGDRLWPDKANWGSLAPFGRKGLSAHWFLQVFAASKWRGARCAGVALCIFLMNFSTPSDGARNVRRVGARYFFAVMRASAI
jgi:hypothetical protein